MCLRTVRGCVCLCMSVFLGAKIETERRGSVCEELDAFACAYTYAGGCVNGAGYGYKCLNTISHINIIMLLLEMWEPNFSNIRCCQKPSR